MIYSMTAFALRKMSMKDILTKHMQ